MIVGIGSWRGTGATTTALLLAAALGTESPSWLVEADPAGGVLGGRAAVPRHTVGALERIAFPTVRSTTTADRFEHEAARLGDVRVITAPGDPFRAWACHTPRLAWAPLLRELDGDVVVDLGTFRGAAPSTAVLGHLDELLLVTEPTAFSVVTTAMWLEALGRVSPVDAGIPPGLGRIVLVDTPGVSERLGRTALLPDLGSRAAGWLPWSTPTVDAVLRGVPFGERRMRRQPLVHAVEELAAALRQVVTT